MAGRRKKNGSGGGLNPCCKLSFGNCSLLVQSGFLAEVNELLLFGKAVFSASQIFLEFSESLAKGSSLYSAIVAHPGGERSVIFIDSCRY